MACRELVIPGRSPATCMSLKEPFDGFSLSGEIGLKQIG